MKIALGLATLFLLSGCMQPSGHQVQYEIVPPELSDCKFYKLASSDGKLSTITVVRCPNSTTSTTFKLNKSPTATVVLIDGKQYVEKPSE